MILQISADKKSVKPQSSSKANLRCAASTAKKQHLDLFLLFIIRFYQFKIK
jgi:hypothetical protein